MHYRLEINVKIYPLRNARFMAVSHAESGDNATMYIIYVLI